MRTISRRLRAAGEIGIIIFVLGACTQQASEESGGNGSGDHGYRSEVSTSERGQLAVADQLREIDPCGFFDVTAFAQDGTVTSMGQDSRTLGQCSVRFDYKAPNNRGSISTQHGFVTVDIASPLVEGPRLANEGTTTIQGTQVFTTEDAQRCEYRFPLGITADQSTESEESSMPYASVYGATSEKLELGCRLAKKTATAIINAAQKDTFPMRTDARLVAPMSDRDPCQVLDHLPSGYEFSELETKYAPRRCIAFLETPKARTSLYVTFAIQNKELAANSDEYNEERIDTINGKRVLRSTYDRGGLGRCTVTFISGEPFDIFIAKPKWVSSDTKMFTTTSIESADCDLVNQIVPAAMDLYDARE